METLREGSIFGRYRVIRLLGQGGMADVYEAEDIELGRRVALKVLPAAFARDQERVARFQKEVRAAASLEHPGIVPLFEVGAEDGSQYFAMALLGGGELKSRLSRGALKPSTATRVLRDIADALNYAHEKGFVHRDVKPENILFREAGNAVLSDFGIARAMGSGTRMTGTGLSIGTPHYMSPEQARGKEVDGRSDLYALGVVFHEMLTGKVPFDAQDSFAVGLMHINDAPPKLPPELQAYQLILDKLLAKDPDERYQSGSQLLTDLEQLEQGAAIEPPPHATRMVQRPRAANTKTDAPSASPPDISSAWKWALGGAALAAFIAVGAYAWWDLNRSTGILAGHTTPSGSAGSDSNVGSRSSAPAESEKAVAEDQVLQAQQLLNRLGFPVPESGDLGPRTAASIRAFEREQELLVSGAVDGILIERLRAEFDSLHENAWSRALQEATVGAYQDYIESFPDGRYGQEARRRISEIKRAEEERQQLVRDIQSELRRLGRDVYPDGQYGESTAGGIRSFERAAGLEITGEVDKQLLARLRATRDWPTQGIPFASTRKSYAWGDPDLDGACRTELGSRFQIADWHDVTEYFENGQSGAEFFRIVGLADDDAHRWVQRGGRSFHSSSRRYFISRHDNQKPSHYLAHDDISDNLISLGSWKGNRKILCRRVTS